MATKKSWSFQVTTEGIIWLLVAAGLIILGAWKGINLILLLAYGLVALWLVHFGVAWRTPLGLRANRVDTGPVFAGQVAERTVEVTNPTTIPLVGGWIEENAHHCRLLWPTDRLAPGASVRLSRPICFPSRGKLSFGPLEVQGGFPFGLIRFTRQHGESADLLVLPALGRLHLGRFQRWLDRATRGDGRFRPRPQQLPVVEASIHGLRPYRSGDSPRLIHWRTSARRGELMVREFEEPLPHHDLLILVETGSAGHKAEAAVSLAATICWEWCRHRTDHITLALGAQARESSAGSGPEHARRLLEMLAELPTGPIDLAKLGDSLTSLSASRCPVLLVTPIPAGPYADWLRSRVGQRLAVVDATASPDFYTPPVPVEAPVKARAKK